MIGATRGPRTGIKVPDSAKTEQNVIDVLNATPGVKDSKEFEFSPTAKKDGTFYAVAKNVITQKEVALFLCITDSGGFSMFVGSNKTNIMDAVAEATA